MMHDLNGTISFNLLPYFQSATESPSLTPIRAEYNTMKSQYPVTNF